MSSSYGNIFFFFTSTFAYAILVAANNSCHQSFKLKEHEQLLLDLTNITGSSDTQTYDCIIELFAEQQQRLVLNITYIPRSVDGQNVKENYLHIGNDGTAIGRELMTSYKIYNETVGSQIVSRYNYVWAVLKSSQRPHVLNVSVTAEREVSCTQDQMSCSPVQCVAKTAVCDGHIDCQNGHDEYCYNLNSETPPWLLLTKEQGTVSWREDSCFMCRDSTCIKPKLSRDNPDWGIPLWFLCDNVRHCPDGWDERRDICLRIKGKLHAVFQCIPSALPFGANVSVFMWSTYKCDGRVHCRNEEDERECVQKEAHKNTLHAEPLTITALLIFVGVICTAAFCGLRLDEKRSRIESNENADVHPARLPGKEVQSCLMTARTDMTCLASEV